VATAILLGFFLYTPWLGAYMPNVPKWFYGCLVYTVLFDSLFIIAKLKQAFK